MKKIKLTQEEETLFKEGQEIARQLSILNKKKEKLNADFWYLLIQRVPGNYTADMLNGNVYELSFEEANAKENKK
jgi:hypothetical protein